MLLAEEVFLLCHDPAGQPICKPDALKAAVSGAVFTELAVLDRVSIIDMKHSPGRWTLDYEVGATGDELLDRLFTQVQRYRYAQPHMAMHLLRDDIWTAVTQRLLQQAVLSSTEPPTFVPDYHRPAVAAAHVSSTRTALEAALVNGVPPAARTTALINILQVVSVLETVMAPPDRAAKKTIRKNAKAFAAPKTVATNMAICIKAAVLAAAMKLGPGDAPATYTSG